MEAFGSIREGVTVSIQRSDGRVHNAVVTQLHTTSNSVSVEWTEKNETKGKEIELEALALLNSALLNNNNSNNNINNVNNNNNNRGAPTNRAANGDNNGTVNGGHSKPVRSRQTLAPSSLNANPLQQQQLAPQTSRNNVIQSNNSNNNNIINEADRRKSNVVKEIEKISQNRVQRRQQQEEKRQKINEIDTSVPAWEFSNMIDDFRSGLDFTRITNGEPIGDARISVCVRKRPINKKETSKKDIDVITMPNKDICLVHLPKVKVDLTKYLDNQKFRFDFNFDESTSNDLVYKYSAYPLVNTIFQG
jgi:kinesin family member 2/24